MCDAFALTLLLGACHSGVYYADRSVKEARAFVLKNAGELELSFEEQEFIKFHKPVLLYAPVLANESFSVEQYNIAWVLPTLKRAILVCGYSDRSMSNWTPNRIVVRDMEPWDQNRRRAEESARAYAVNNLFHSLTVAQYNRVRFCRPEVLATNFSLAEEQAGEVNLKQLEAKEAALSQYSVVWRFPDDATLCLVATGLAQEDLAGWKINFCAIMDPAELGRHTIDDVPEITLDSSLYKEE